MIVLSEAELALLAGAGGLAAYAGRQKQNCPFHRALLVASNVALAGGGLYILWRSWADSPFLGGGIGVKRARGGKGVWSNGSGEGEKEEDPRVQAVLALVRKNILELEPYRCARDDYSEGILLDANENSFGSALPAKDQALKLERYPDPYQQELKQKIGKYRGVRPEQIFVGVGSDEAIDLIMRIFCEPGKDSILITPPTYGMYKVSAKTNDVGIVSVPLNPAFEVRVKEVRQGALLGQCVSASGSWLVSELGGLGVDGLLGLLAFHTRLTQPTPHPNLPQPTPNPIIHSGAGGRDPARQGDLHLLAREPHGQARAPRRGGAGPPGR